NNFFEASNKDELTRRIAEINSSDLKEEYLSFESHRDAYEHAMEVLQTVNATQESIDQAYERIVPIRVFEQDLEAASRVEQLIAELPEAENLQLSDQVTIESARSAYDALTDAQKSLVSNIDKLEQLEERLAQMAQETSDQEAASQVVELIESLPSVDELTLSDREQIESARSAYDALTDAQKS